MCTSSMDTLHWWKQFLPSTNIVIRTLGKWPGCSIKNNLLTWNLQLVSISALKPKAPTRLQVTAPTAELTRWRARNWINQEIEILVEPGKCVRLRSYVGIEKKNNRERHVMAILGICEYNSFAYKAHRCKWVDPWTQGEHPGKVVASDEIKETLCATVEHNVQGQVSNVRQGYGQHSTMKAKQDSGSQQDVDLKWTVVKQG